MDKIKKHFQENILIYLVLITCIIIFSIIVAVNRRNELDFDEVDTSLFMKENIMTTLELFEQNEPIYLVLGVDNCSATHDYVDYLRYQVANIGLKVHYLDLNSIEEDDKENYEKLVEKLSIDYNLFGTVDKFGKFIGNTPMTIIIKDHKQVYGYIGSMNNSSIESIAKLYGTI